MILHIKNCFVWNHHKNYEIYQRIKIYSLVKMVIQLITISQILLYITKENLKGSYSHLIKYM